MMPKLLDERTLFDLPRGAHVCWVVADDDRYLPIAKALIDQGRAANEKVLAFAPSDSPILAELAPVASVVGDPLAAFLDGRFDARAMFDVFRAQDRAARDEGYRGLSIVADMDWLLGAEVPAVDIIEFELLADRLIKELGATAVCAYRTSSFDHPAIVGAQAVHPDLCGTGSPPPFQLTAGEGGWVLRGEVDRNGIEHLAAALDALAAEGPATIDAGELEFLDVAAMRTLATSRARADLRLEGMPASLRRHWDIGGFGSLA